MNPWQAEPYRVLFPLGMLLGVVAIAAWGMVLTGSAPIAHGPGDHGITMLLGVFGTVVLGFLGSAWPKQNQGRPWGLPVTLALGLVQTTLVLGLLAGGAWRQPVLGLAAATWLAAGVWSAWIARGAWRRGGDASSRAGPVTLIACAIALALAGARGHGAGVLPRMTPALALHAGVLPLALLLLDRVLPFFSKRPHPGVSFVRKRGFAAALVLGGTARALVEGLPLPDARLAQGLLDLTLAAVILRQWHGWRPWRGWRPPLLGVLHLGIAWIVGGYLLHGLATWLPLDDGAIRHAWLVGGLGTLVVGFATRVTRGHGGFPLVLGWDGALALVLVQAAVLLRVLPALAGAAHPHTHGAAALCLAAAFLLWLVRLGPKVRPLDRPLS